MRRVIARTLEREVAGCFGRWFAAEWSRQREDARTRAREKACSREREEAMSRCRDMATWRLRTGRENARCRSRVVAWTRRRDDAVTVGEVGHLFSKRWLGFRAREGADPPRPFFPLAARRSVRHSHVVAFSRERELSVEVSPRRALAVNSSLEGRSPWQSVHQAFVRTS